MILAVMLCFLLAVSRLQQQGDARGREQLESVLRRTAVSCYASEGFYPPSVAYMQEHWGLQYDEETYAVHYNRFASNLMPDITVVERRP